MKTFIMDSNNSIVAVKPRKPKRVTNSVYKIKVGDKILLVRQETSRQDRIMYYELADGRGRMV